MSENILSHSILSKKYFLRKVLFQNNKIYEKYKVRTVISAEKYCHRYK